MSFVKMLFKITELAEIDKKLYNISDQLAEGFKIEKSYQDDVYSRRKKLQEDLLGINEKLSAFEDSDALRAKADTTRTELLKRFKSVKRIKEMSFAEKREMLSYFFNGTDRKGKPYAIYLDKNGAGEPLVSLYGYIPINLGPGHALVKKIFKTKKKLGSQDTENVTFKREKTWIHDLYRLTKLF